MRDGLEWLPPYLDAKDRFTLEYNTTNSYILHYSNVRSALASFLITVALASFAAYYSTTNSDRTVVDVGSDVGNSAVDERPPGPRQPTGRKCDGACD